MRELRILLRDEPLWVAHVHGPNANVSQRQFAQHEALACVLHLLRERFCRLQELGLVSGEEELALARGVLAEDVGLSIASEMEDDAFTMFRNGADGGATATESPSAVIHTSLCPIQFARGFKTGLAAFLQGPGW